jgi:hypothetical protein
MVTTPAIGRRNLGTLTGASIVALWIGGTATQDMSGSPRPTDSMDKAQAFFADSGNAGATAFNSGMSILAALALLWFAGLMAGFLRQRGRPGSAPDIVLLGGGLAAGTRGSPPRPTGSAGYCRSG